MSDPVLRGLTLHRPWAAAIVFGPKRAENRNWAPMQAFPPGSVLAIHSGMRWDVEGAEFIRERWPELSMDQRHHRPGEILGLAEVLRYERVNRDPTPADPWACGPWAWRLGRVVPLLIPVPARGAQGLWTIPLPLEQTLRRMWLEAA